MQNHTFSEVQNGNIITRTVLVNISGSLTDLNMSGESGATWKPIEGKQTKVFGVLNENADAQAAANQLRTALIHEVNLLEHHSTFPVPLGITFSCIPSTEYTDLGKAYSYIVLPKSIINSPHNIYKCNVNIENSLSWRNEYPRWNSTNLETEGVMNVPHNNFVFVSQEHPIIALLRNNSSLIGCDIDSQPKVDDEWYKVSRHVLSACCDTLRTKVLNNIATNDLNMGAFSAERIGADQWDDITDVNIPLQGFKKDPTWTAEECEKFKSAHVSSFLTTPYNYMARVQIKYEVQNPV
jgi:hypothetical protein